MRTGNPLRLIDLIPDRQGGFLLPVSRLVRVITNRHIADSTLRQAPKPGSLFCMVVVYLCALFSIVQAIYDHFMSLIENLIATFSI